jgi:DNA polymerase I
VYVSSAISHADDSSLRDPLLLVDASAYIFRAYYSMPPFHRADGTPVGAVLGFCNMLNRLVLNRLLAGETPRLVLVFDPIGKNFRHDLYPEYKANRKECPIDLKPQFALIREAAKAYGIHELEAEGYEADDVIATLVTMAMEEGVDCHILSGDKDLMQLITPLERTESYVHVIDPMSMARVDYTAVVGKWGVGPELVGDLLAIMGDSSDNIPGIKGVGPKIGTSLLLQFKSLDAILADPSSIEKKAQRTKIEQNIEIARLSRQLVDLVRDIPREKMTFPEDFPAVADLRLLKFYQNMGFKDLTRRLEGRLSTKPVPPKKKSPWKGRELTTIPKPEDFDDVPF